MTNPSIFHGSEDGNDLLVLGDVADPAKFRLADRGLHDRIPGRDGCRLGADWGTCRFAIELGVHGIA